MWRFPFLVGVALLVCTFNFASASSVSVDFFDASLNEDGSIFVGYSQATPEKSTLEALLTLQLLDSLDSSTAITALSNLKRPNANSSTELLAYWVTLNPDDVGYSESLAQLASRQNIDGGFGQFKSFSSDPLNTSFALLALKKSGYAHKKMAKAVSYLLKMQSSLGSWNLVAKESPLQTIELTALASNVLWTLRKQFPTLPAVDTALDYLIAQKSGDLWPTTEASALALLALVNRLVDRSSLDSTVAAFASLQAENGSFDHDVYSTALGLRVLSAYASESEDVSVIRGRVIDAEFGAPIANANIEVTGVGTDSLIADSDGFFTTTNLVPGTYDVEISQSGFSRISYKATISEGTKADLGDVKLSKVETDPVTGESVVTGFIRGVIQDKGTGSPINKAIVSLPSGQSATTNANGEYSISGVQPGQVTMSIFANSYQSVQGNANVGERQTIVFSPLLSELEDPEVRISGVITDRDSGQPLAGVVIFVGNGTDIFNEVTDTTGS